MAQTSQCVSVEQFKHLGMARAHAEQEDSLLQGRGEHGRATFELLAHVLAAVADRFQPTIGFLGHDFNNSA